RGFRCGDRGAVRVRRRPRARDDAERRLLHAGGPADPGCALHGRGDVDHGVPGARADHRRARHRRHDDRIAVARRGRDGRCGGMTRELRRAIEPLTTTLLVPLFFVYSGLNTRLLLIDSAGLWLTTAVVFLTACAGKGLACWAAARATGATARQALAIATLMNARGTVELILVNLGLQRGLITPTLFTLLVLMAI